MSPSQAVSWSLYVFPLLCITNLTCLTTRFLCANCLTKAFPSNGLKTMNTAFKTQNTLPEIDLSYFATLIGTPALKSMLMQANRVAGACWLRKSRETFTQSDLPLGPAMLLNHAGQHCNKNFSLQTAV